MHLFLYKYYLYDIQNLSSDVWILFGSWWLKQGIEVEKDGGAQQAHWISTVIE